MVHMWTSTVPSRSVMDELMEHKDKQIAIVMTTTGAQRITGKLQDVMHDGLVLDRSTAVGGMKNPVFVMSTAIATVEVLE